MVKLKVLERYEDKELRRYVQADEIIEVSTTRYKDMQKREKEIGRKFFEEVKEEKKVTTKAETSKK